VNFGSASLLGFAAGYDFACARLSAATSPQVRCWGSHDEGQLGFTPTASMVSLANTTTILNATPLLAIGAGRTHACVIHANESMSCWGVNYYGELGLGVGGSPHPTPTAVQLGSFKAKAIALGMNHTCAIVDKTSEPRSIKCWGHNDKGQLGINSMQSLGNTPNGMGNALQSVILPGGFVPMRIAAGGDTTCAASETGQVLCWGSNTLGHLGQGRTDASIGNTAGSMQTLVPIDLGWP
jgi:alpha-tubulin suppressor-like RCC1 family protein